MSKPRYFFDEKSQTALLLPDLLSISVISKSDDGQDTIFTLAASMTIEESWKSGFDMARMIILENPFFKLRKPSSLVNDFQFIQSPLVLEGNCTLIVSKNKSHQVEEKIANDVTFLQPEYSGTSEVFLSRIEIAKAIFTSNFIEHLGLSNSISQQIFKIVEFLKDKPLDTNQMLALADIVINNFGDIVRADGRWKINIPPGEKIVCLEESKEVKNIIRGDKTNISVKIM